jgi:hypothetical protein
MVIELDPGIRVEDIKGHIYTGGVGGYPGNGNVRSVRTPSSPPSVRAK